MVVTVTAGGVSKTFQEAPSGPVPTDQARWFPTVEEAFAMIERAFEDDAHRVDVRYDPATKATKTVIPRLSFPNGICVTHDDQSILIGQTWLCRILRYWYAGPKAGAIEIFLENLPGYVDNINRASDGGYWVALTGMRSPIYDLSMRMPRFRRRMMKRVPPDEWLATRTLTLSAPSPKCTRFHLR